MDDHGISICPLHEIYLLGGNGTGRVVEINIDRIDIGLRNGHLPRMLGKYV